MTDTIKFYKTNSVPTQFGPNCLYMYKDTEDRVVLALTDKTGEVVYTSHTTQSIEELVYDRITSVSNIANGLAGLDADGKIHTSQIPNELVHPCLALTGPTIVATGATVSYTVVGYSLFDTYAVSTTTGTVSIAGNTVTYTAPGTPQSVILYLNDIEHTVDIVPATNYVATPTLISPIIGSTNMGPDVLYTSSAFVYVGAIDTHLSSDWQIATDIEFVNIHIEIIDSTINQTSFFIDNLAADTVYYARVRHKGTTFGYSNWSKPSYLVTKLYYIPTTEVAKLISSAPGTSDHFGITIAADNTTARIVVGIPDSDLGGGLKSGSVRIYRRSQSVWEEEIVLTKASPASFDYYGSSVAINSNGNRVLVGARGVDTGKGAVYSYVRNNGAWALESTITKLGGNPFEYFGYAVDCDELGGRMIVGGAQMAQVYRRDGTVWTQELNGSLSGLFGKSVAINSDGSRVLISRPESDDGPYIDSGSVYVYARSGQTWSFEALLTASDADNGCFFGWSVDIDSTGSKAVVGAHRSSPGAISESGAVYVYTRTGTTWTQDVRLTPSDPVAGGHFGESVSMSLDGSRVIAGSPFAKNGAATTGAAYLYVKNGSWVQTNKYTASSAMPGDYFGQSVAISNTRAAISAPMSDTLAIVDSGAVYVYK